MPAPVGLSLATKEDVQYIVDIKTDVALWMYEVEAEIETDKEIMRKTVLERMDSDWYWQYVIHLQDADKTPIGDFHIHTGDETRNNYEIGYCILPPYRGNGYAAEAGKIALRILFEDRKAHRVYAMCNSMNIASDRTLRRLGMQRDGIFRQELPWRGRWVDQHYYAMLDDEFAALYGSQQG